ncbi:uncharacterized protein [Dermacentor andersoni]|uniref:uncharacterized protein isoform X2 n=1 Tax=Dermacentor andersoni TaxID=34620 RepID=UPI0024161C34|nr:nascent polypeptide-associated complex subunit alpha, muscle-specific form-like isoform X2 [Dermacentor andersoni]
MDTTEPYSEVLIMALILIGAIALFVVLWLLMRKYGPSPEKASGGGGAPSGVAQVPHPPQTTTGDAATITQPPVLADRNAAEPTAEPASDKSPSGATSVERVARGAMSPGRRFANAAQKPSVGWNIAAREQTASMQEALSSAPEGVQTNALPDRKRSVVPQSDRARFGAESPVQSPEGTQSPRQRFANAARKASMAVGRAVKHQATNMLEVMSSGAEGVNTQALDEKKAIEPEEPPCDRDRRAMVTADHPADGTVSPGRRFVNAARKASVAVSHAVRVQTTHILESLSTGADMVQVASDETTSNRKASSPTEQGGEAKPTMAVAPPKDGGVVETDAKAHKNPLIPGQPSPTRTASPAATLADKREDEPKVEAAGEKKPLELIDEAKPSQPPLPTGSNVAPPRGGTAAASDGGGAKAREGALTPPGGDNVAAGMSSPRPNSADHSPADESALLPRETTSNIGKSTHRHRRKSKKKIFAGSAASGSLVQSPALSGIRRSSAKRLSTHHKVPKMQELSDQ